MKLPGRAWLQFEVTPRPGGGSEIRQTAIFEPVGLAGLLYRHLMSPLHGVIFRGMLAGIAARAEAAPPRGGGRGGQDVSVNPSAPGRAPTSRGKEQRG